MKNQIWRTFLLLTLAACLLVTLASCSSAPKTAAENTATGYAPWASAQGQDQFGKWADLTVGGVTQRFRWIKPGTFVMGSPQSEKDAAVAMGALQGWLQAYEVQHQVTLTRGFWLADTPCTQGLWQAVLGSNPSQFTGDNRLPVEQVSWDDCRAFLEKLNGQVRGGGFGLPTEAQWEYAARAGTTGAQYGNLEDIAWYNDNSGRHTHPVKQKQPNAWGLYDMIGNVWQWCGDWLAAYPAGPQRDPSGPSSGSGHVRRGASWANLTRYCRAAIRLNGTPSYRSGNVGFRLAAPAVQIPRAEKTPPDSAHLGE